LKSYRLLALKSGYRLFLGKTRLALGLVLCRTGLVGFLLSLFYGSLAWAESRPVVIPLGKSGVNDLNAVLPDEKTLILVVFFAQIAWALMQYVWKRKEKSDDHSAEKLDRLFSMVHEIQGEIKILRRAPSEDEMVVRLQPHIELGVLRALKKHDHKGP
jgi:hypothetical protein